MLKSISLKTIFIMLLLILFLFGCEDDYSYKEETFKLKQLTNSSATILHSHFLSSSSSSYEQTIKFAYYNKEGAIKLFSTHITNCQIFEDVDKIENAYLKIRYKSYENRKNKSAEDKLQYFYGTRKSEEYLILSFHVPKNSIENFIIIDVKK